MIASARARVCVWVNWNKNNPKSYAFAIYWFFVIGPIAIESAILFCHSLYDFFVLFCIHWMCEHILVMIIMLLRMHVCEWRIERIRTRSSLLFRTLFRIIFSSCCFDRAMRRQRQTQSTPIIQSKSMICICSLHRRPAFALLSPSLFSFDLVFYLVRCVCVCVSAGRSVCLSIGHIFSIPP